MARPMLGAISVVCVLVYAGLSTRWVGHDPGWYSALPRPWWQPPAWVFGLIWPLNFMALALVSWVIANRAGSGAATAYVVVLALSVAAALFWAYTFYVPHDLLRAAVSLAAAAVLTWLLVGLAGTVVAWAGWVLLPYAVWMTIATTLAFGYWHLVAAS